MKATDLMVGDWVMNACDTPRKVYELVQDQVTYELEGGGLNTAHCNQLYPIPLTEEILVKNGFDKDERSRYYHEYILELELWDFDISWTNAGGFKYEDIRLAYVHQLQRLLNLCNIDKEIIL